MHAAQLAQLQEKLTAAERTAETYKHLYTTELTISSHFESTISTIMTMIRKYCHDKEVELINTTTVWKERLQEERDRNLEMRLEHSRWQDGLGRAMHWARMALRSASEEEEPFAVERAELRHENRFMRRLLGWEADESEDEAEDAPEIEGEQEHVA